MQPLLQGFSHGVHQIHWVDKDVWLIVQSWGQLVVAKTGAQILHYQPVGQAPVFWINQPDSTSINKADSQRADKNIRAGVPLCWPWFGAHSTDKTAPNHGYARDAQWQLMESELLTEPMSARLCFVPVNRLIAELAVSFEINVSAQALTMRLVTHNISEQEQRLSQALHSYFKVGDIEQVILQELAGSYYLDSLDYFQEKWQACALTNIGAIDNIYKHCESLTIKDPVLQRQIQLTKSGSGSTVVWNPGDDYRNYAIQTGHREFLCVEAANTAHEQLVLDVGQQWVLEQKVEVLAYPTGDSPGR